MNCHGDIKVRTDWPAAEPCAVCGCTPLVGGPLFDCQIVGSWYEVRCKGPRSQGGLEHRLEISGPTPEIAIERWNEAVRKVPRDRVEHMAEEFSSFVAQHASKVVP
jgi:hypothetical protein